MNGIVLCEGETDQILLNTYFGHRYGFKYVRNASKSIPLNKNSWTYARSNGDLVQISSVGGKDNFTKTLEQILKRNSINTTSEACFDYVAVMMDHDSDNEVQDMIERFHQVFQRYSQEIHSQYERWTCWEQKTEFDEIKPIYFLLIPIPNDGEGALETFLLHALTEKRENTYLVQESNAFVAKLTEELHRQKLEGHKECVPEGVLASRRSQIKAPLAVYFGVVNPERTFTKFDDILNSIDWSTYESIQTGFKAFDDVIK